MSDAVASSSSLRGQRILSEEDYIASLSSLIQRDFFPNLPRLKAENEYLEALEELDDGLPGGGHRLRAAERELDRLDEQDKQGAAAAKRQRRQRRAQGSSTRRSVTPADTPLRPLDRRWDPTPSRRSSRGWTPSEVGTPRRQEVARRDPRPAHYREDEPSTSIEGHSLSSFQALHTSEDNASFLELLHATNASRKERYAWAFRQEKTHNARRQLILDEAAKRADEGYARSFLTLPEERRQKLLAAGRLDPAIAKRVGQIERLARSDTDGQKLLGTQQQLKLRIRASSEEPQGAAETGTGPLAKRARSASPSAISDDEELAPLKHSIDPRSEIRLEASTSRNKLPDDSNEEDLSFDPNAILRPQATLPSATLAAGHKYRARNALFFGPDADVETVDRASSSLPSVSADPKVNAADRLFNARSELKAQTNFHNTALPSQGLFPESKYPFLSSSASKGAGGSTATSASPKSSRIASALAGGGSRYGDNFDEDGQDRRDEGPMVNGYGFVTPGRDTPASTRGEQTPGSSSRERLRGLQSAKGDGSSSSRFRIAPTPRREALAHSLATSDSAKKRKTSSGNALLNRFVSSNGSSSRTPERTNTPSRRSNALSPAARTLLDRSTRRGVGLVGTPGRTDGWATPTIDRHRSQKTSESQGRDTHGVTRSMPLEKRGWEEP